MEEYTYSTHTKNGKFMTIPTMEDCVDAILTRHEHAIDRITYLENEVKKLKDEKYKDEELRKAEQRLKDMTEDYFRGFPITKEEKDKIDEWQDTHDSEKHGLNTTQSRLKAGGCIGGRYYYKFIPTSIGTIGCVVCSKCNEEFEFCSL